MKTIFKNGQTKQTIFLNGDVLFHVLPESGEFPFLMDIPCVHVLANHDGIDADVPHHGGAMTFGVGFKFKKAYKDNELIKNRDKK